MIRFIILTFFIIFSLCFVMNSYANSFEECNPNTQTCVKMTLREAQFIHLWVAIYENDQIKDAVELGGHGPRSFTYRASQLDTTISLKIINEACFTKALQGPLLQNVLIDYDFKDKKFVCR